MPDEHDESEVLLEALRERIRGALRDFAVPVDGERAADTVTVSVGADRLPVPRLAEWVLTWGLGAPNYGKAEKRAWLVRFKYQDRLCSLGLFKFGMRLSAERDVPDQPPTYVDQLLSRVDRAVRVAESQLLADYAEQQLQLGNLTIENQYYTFANMYAHFRIELEKTGTEQHVPEQAGDWVADLGRHMNAIVEVDRDRFHLSVAMVNAYFSLLEHTLVLLWPFTTYRPGHDNPESMIKSRWAEKFKAVFDVVNDQNAKRIYDQLRDVAEKYRNTYAHGGFDKQRGALFIPFPGGPPIPASLSDGGRRVRTSFFPVAEPEVNEILTVIDETEEWLRSGPSALGMQFVESGIDVPFEAETLAELRSEMIDSVHLENYLRGLSRWLDDQTNMDW